MKHILIRSGKSPFDVATPERVLQQDLIGTNSGNLLFSDAAHKLLLTESTTVTSNGIRTDCSARRAAQINEEYDVFVVPLANAFRPAFEASLDRLSTLIEQLTVPVVVFGVGAQTGADYDTGPLKALEPAVRRFMTAVLDRSASVGVRGELTADYLEAMGFADVDVIGCPSMFLHGDTFPALDKRPGGITDASRIALSVSPDAVDVGPLAALVDHTYERFADLTYYAQNLTDAELLFWGDISAATGAADELPLRRTHPLVRDGRTRVPIDPHTWIEELRGHDFAFGTRIHGNVAALLAGTPAVVLAHDSRTRELCRYFGIPHRMLDETPADVDPVELYEQADFTELHAGHAERFARVVRFLDENGLENTFTHGDRGAAFDKRMASLQLPPSFAVWDGSDDGRLGYRVAWLREQALQARRRQEAANRRAAALREENAALTARLAGLEERVDLMERRLSGVDRRVRGIDRRLLVRLGPALRRRLGRGGKRA